MITVALITLILALLTVAIFNPTSSGKALQLRTCNFVLVKQKRGIDVQYVNCLANENTQTTIMEQLQEVSNRLSDDA